MIFVTLENWISVAGGGEVKYILADGFDSVPPIDGFVSLGAISVKISNILSVQPCNEIPPNECDHFEWGDGGLVSYKKPFLWFDARKCAEKSNDNLFSIGGAK